MFTCCYCLAKQLKKMNFLLLFLSVASCQMVCGQEGFSFHKFSGPVSGRLTQIPVQNPRRHGASVDYVAKPDYAYSFGVADPQTGNSQNHQETRNGDAVQGEYSLVQADGVLRIVRYTSDPKNGFQATVEYKQ